VREGGSGTGEGAQGPLPMERGLYINICASPTPSRVPSYATADGAGPVFLLSQGQFGDPVCPWLSPKASGPETKKIRTGSLNRNGLNPFLKVF